MGGLRGVTNGIIVEQAKQGVEVKITENDLNRMWDIAEENHDGKMNFEEFVHLIMLVILHAIGSLDNGSASYATAASDAASASYYQNQVVPETPESSPPAYTASTPSNS
jgi:hypothetical protein